MTDSVESSELRNQSLDFDRQYFIRKWLTQNRSHMAASHPPISLQTSAETHSSVRDSEIVSSRTTSLDLHKKSSDSKFNRKANESNNKNAKNSYNKLFVLLSNGGTGSPKPRSGAHKKRNLLASNSDFSLKGGPYVGAMGHHVDAQKPTLRSFNSHDTSANMFSVADFENARLVRRNEIEMKKRLLRRMRSDCNGFSEGNITKVASTGNVGTDVCRSSLNECSTDFPPGASLMSLNLPDVSLTNNSQQDPLPADLFFESYSTPTFVRISYKTKSYDETLQSFSSHGSGATTHSSASAERIIGANGFCTTPTGSGNSDGVNTGTSSSTGSSSTNINLSMSINGRNYNQDVRKFPTEIKDSNQKLCGKGGDLYLLYKFINHRSIFHGHDSKTANTNRKKAVLIPQEFPGYFSLMDDKGLPRATQYTSLMQLVRERVAKFISMDSIPAFAATQANLKLAQPEECFPNYSKGTPSRLQYSRTTARGGEVYRLIAVFADDNATTNESTNNVNSHKHGSQNRDKEKGRYAQLMNDARQVFYASLSVKGKFYEVEPGVPFILQRSATKDMERKINPDCVYRITDVVTPKTNLPVSICYISGPSTVATGMPESVTITRISKENVLIVSPINETEKQRSFHLQKLYLTEEMHFVRSSLGFDTDKNLWSDPYVQSIVKYCQFNCDSLLQTVDKETIKLPPERPSSKDRSVGAKLLKPLHFTKLLRREKTSKSADEKEGSIIFLTKSDLDNLEVKDNPIGPRTTIGIEPTTPGNGVPEKMKVFQPTKKKWFRKEDKNSLDSSMTSLDAQMRRMSMERYKDISKLLQDRFDGESYWNCKEKSNPKSSLDRSISDIENSALGEIKTKLKMLEQAASMKQEPNVDSNALLKSLSLQDLESKCHRCKTETAYTSESISETELTTLGSTQTTSFITEKLFNEFHAKSRKFSKSSSSLNKLLNFSQPQKMQLSDHKRRLAKLRENFSKKSVEHSNSTTVAPVIAQSTATDQTNPSIIESITQENSSRVLTTTMSSLIEDELPYSSVRDSLLFSNENDVNIKENRSRGNDSEVSYSGEDGNNEAIFPSDDFGDYASLYRPTKECSHNQHSVQAFNSGAFNRDQVQCRVNSTGSHTVFLNSESLHGESKSYGCESYCSRDSTYTHHSCDRSHITTVELSGTSYSQGANQPDNEGGAAGSA